jgi:hypothetical protein
MSLAVPTETIRAVLLPDGWHHIDAGSFTVDAFDLTFGAGDHEQLGSGCSFTEGRADCRTVARVSSIIAVEHDHKW